MVDVEKDDREWDVQVILSSDECPFRYYPANYVGCKVHEDYGHEDTRCRCDGCPMLFLQ